MDVVVEEERREEDGELAGERLEGRKFPAPPMEVLMYFCFWDGRERREEVLLVEVWEDMF